MSEIPYTVISALGPDAYDFLQAQLTVDLEELRDARESSSMRSAWCNPKGRVICMPTVHRVDDGFQLTVPANLAERVLQRLGMFRFRSRVELAATSEEAIELETAHRNLIAGVPEIALEQSEKFTPHMLNLDLLRIVSLDKGCYPGQEIVARTHYRGASKRRLQRYSSDKPAQPGDKISLDDREIGEVVNAIGNDLLAVVPVDRADARLTIGRNGLSHRQLPYFP